MKKVLGRAVLVLLMSPLLHAGPLTPADLAYLDVDALALHNKIKELRAGGSKTILDIGGTGGDNIVPYLNNTTSSPPYTNTTALQTIMGDWSATPKTYGVIGDYQPTDHADSLYHKIAHTSGSVFADLGYGIEYGIEPNLRAKIRDGLFGDLGHKTDGASDSASTRASDILDALGNFTGGGTTTIYNIILSAIPPTWTWTPSTPPVPSISSQRGIFGSLGVTVTGTNVSTRISNLLLTLGTRTATDTEATANNITEAISDAIGSYTPTTDYYTGILGKLTDPAAEKGVFGDLGYAQTTIKDKINTGLFGDLGGTADTSASARMTEIFGALGGKAGSANIPTRNTDENLLSWINRISSGGGGDNIVPYLNNDGGGHTNTTALQTVMGDWNAATETYGKLGLFMYSNWDIKRDLYSIVSDETKPNIVNSLPFGILGTLRGTTSAGDGSVSVAFRQIRDAIAIKFPISKQWINGESLLDWVNKQ